MALAILLNCEDIVRVMRQLISFDKFFANSLLLAVHNFKQPEMSGIKNQQWQWQEMNL
jgi:hypothetical protein